MEDNIVFGKIPAKNAIVGKRKPTKIFLNEAHPDPELVALIKKYGLVMKTVSLQELNRLSGNKNHQGVVCFLPAFQFTPLEELLTQVRDKKDSTIIMLDGIEDPVNFGSIIRTSTGFNVDGIIIGKNRQVQVTGTVSKVATGGEEIIPIVQVTNLSQTLDKLKKEGYWVVASAGEGKDLYDRIDYSGKIVLVIGSEGFGVSKLVREHSDFIASIPLEGKVKALNAAIACAVFVAQIDSYRRNKKK